MISIYHALKKQGAPVMVATHGGTHEPLLKQSGVPYEIVGPQMSNTRCVEFVKSGAGMGPPTQSFYSDQELRTYVKAEAELFQKHGVRAAITGFTMSATLSTQVAKIPLITEHSGAYLPPIWERNLIEAPVTPMIPWLKYLPTFVRRKIANHGGNKLDLYLSGFHRIGDEFGLPKIPSFAALMLGNVALVTEVSDVLGISDYEMRTWAPKEPGYWPNTKLRYTGPIYAELDIPVPPRVEEFLQGSHPIVYVAITSSPAETIRSAIENLRSLNVRILVAGTVHEKALKDLESDRVLVEGILPSHKIMPHVDLALIAGGQGSVQCALASGVPILGVPLQPEQDLNVALLEKATIAKRISPAQLRTDKLRTSAQEILENPQYRTGAQRIQRAYNLLNGPDCCAKTIIELFGDGKKNE